MRWLYTCLALDDVLYLRGACDIYKAHSNRFHSHTVAHIAMSAVGPYVEQISLLITPLIPWTMPTALEEEIVSLYQILFVASLSPSRHDGVSNASPTSS